MAAPRYVNCTSDTLDMHTPAVMINSSPIFCFDSVRPGVAAQNGLHAERFTRRTVYTTQNVLHTERFTQHGTVYTH
jgi:hypothetical protein